MIDPTMDAVLAHRIYGVLVEHAGAGDETTDWAQFVIAQTNGCAEYRFMGVLGFGGKFWHNPIRAKLGTGPGPFYVNCYPEDLNEKRRTVIDRTNAALAELAPDGAKSSWRTAVMERDVG